MNDWLTSYRSTFSLVEVVNNPIVIRSNSCKNLVRSTSAEIRTLSVLDNSILVKNSNQVISRFVEPWLMASSRPRHIVHMNKFQTIASFHPPSSRTVVLLNRPYMDPDFRARATVYSVY